MQERFNVCEIHICPVYKEDNGFVVVNELPLEGYLLTVGPSEMPSNYPADALAASAFPYRQEMTYSHSLSPARTELSN